jgi:hypothetical protein
MPKGSLIHIINDYVRAYRLGPYVVLVERTIAGSYRYSIIGKDIHRYKEVSEEDIRRLI